jgi:tRNA (cytidine/uridine-2'-O-)-methyltransferase
MRIVLFNPQIPQNTGNIVRTCSATNTDLILIPPLGFETSNKMLRRAGLDYWNGVTTSIENDYTTLFNESSHLCFFSSRATQLYTTPNYTRESTLVFGSEITGLPENIYSKYKEHFYTLPMLKGNRCLNLSNAAAIVVYEAWRQLKFDF